MDLTQSHNKWLSEEVLKFSKLATNQKFEFDLTINNSWTKNLLLEVDEKEKIEELTDREFLNISVSIVKKWNDKYNDVIILDGKVDMQFEPPCIRCLCPGFEKLKFNFSTCVMDSKLEDEEDFEELTTFYIDGAERELFYYENLSLNIIEIIHELVYLNKMPFPLHDEKCLGLCQQCGKDQNIETCSH